MPYRAIAGHIAVPVLRLQKAREPAAALAHETAERTRRVRDRVRIANHTHVPVETVIHRVTAQPVNQFVVFNETFGSKPPTATSASRRNDANAPEISSRLSARIQAKREMKLRMYSYVWNHWKKRPLSVLLQTGTRMPAAATRFGARRRRCAWRGRRHRRDVCRRRRSSRSAC